MRGSAGAVQIKVVSPSGHIEWRDANAVFPGFCESA
jgi:hypothetical protein